MVGAETVWTGDILGYSVHGGPGRTLGAEAGMSQDILGCSLQGCPGQSSGAKVGASIPGHFVSVLPWCETAEAVMSTVWECPGVCHTGTPLGMARI